MQTDTNTSPWTLAADHCWKHVETATAVQRVIDKLKDLPIESVTPIISAIGPSIIVVPVGNDDDQKVRIFARSVKLALEDLLPVDSEWTSTPMGDNWSLRLRVKDLTIILSTSIPIAKPTEFKL